VHPLGHGKAGRDCRVVVARSGGGSSSVTAARLVEQGFDVVGITLQLYDHGAALAKKGACCAGRDIHDAARVAERLGIPHYVLDYESRFRRDVIDDFADAYARGETPIPCVRCNQTVKFRDLLATARDLGADALATGHYVRRVDGAGGPELHRAADEGRDQSYFLFATTRAQLAFLRFPLGGMAKDETREVARGQPPRPGGPVSGGGGGGGGGAGRAHVGGGAGPGLGRLGGPARPGGRVVPPRRGGGGGVRRRLRSAGPLQPQDSGRWIVG